MKSITARLSAKFRQALPTNTLCALYTVYIHLLVVYTYTLTTKSVVFTFPWMKSITARLSAKFRQALSTNTLCALYTTFQKPTWKAHTLNYLPNFDKCSPPIICAHYIPHSKILFENRLFSIRQLCTTATNIFETHGYACMRLCFYRLLHPALHCQNRCQSTQFMECCSSTIIGVAYKYCSSAKIRRLMFACMKPTTSCGIFCLPRFRKGSFAPTGDICVYIHLLVVYTYTLTTKSFIFTFPW